MTICPGMAHSMTLRCWITWCISCLMTICPGMTHSMTLSCWFYRKNKNRLARGTCMHGSLLGAAGWMEGCLLWFADVPCPLTLFEASNIAVLYLKRSNPNRKNGQWIQISNKMFQKMNKIVRNLSRNFALPFFFSKCCLRAIPILIKKNHLVRQWDRFIKWTKMTLPLSASIAISSLISVIPSIQYKDGGCFLYRTKR